MTDPVVNAALLDGLLGHVRRWLANLARARSTRRIESEAALQNVVRAARETALYMRQLKATGVPDHARERELALRWTDLGFELQRLGMDALAKRCDIKGREWVDPEQFDALFLARAQVRLSDLEKQARVLLKRV
ncbi:MAG: hypothetical protein V2I63_11480 [Pseudomonadales bacterium]|jgi:hypothetical protein|nr:hypothetical protein [Pseudomonadales bacterium]